MANKMLIDATHPEETRVVVVRGSRVEEFDFEAANRKPLRGNIYLAKVTRVEPSLQAAFIEYGGNRHGFLAFSEIHPDYYQIPVADRQALLAEEERQQKRDAEDEAEDKPNARARRARPARRSDDSVSEGAAEESTDDDNDSGPARRTRRPSADDEGGGVEEVHAEEEVVEQVGSDDALEEVPERQPQRRARSYKIQEVIKRRQIMLVQVVKEERGNKGAALTTYLSLAGRYSVLMPNTARGGGISRKITSAEDRKRLKEVASDLEVPEGMGVILRTAGANRTKAEIKRDFEYLLRLWENVRELTLASTAPSLVYEEGSLIKRSIRDLYNKDIDEVLVGGEEGYREAKDFMRMLMPSHAKNVKPYRDTQPVFARFGVESQLDAMFSPIVQLKSGGYIVINPTEALVSVDVNSGRSTREHNIEDTALKTNLEAAEEVARQLRLRDLAGLIVIDFIDMDEKRNNRAVERKLKDCLKNDRARIQLGRISHFGLMEMSRQRIRTGVLESSTEVCPHCGGTGHVRSSSSVALQLLRGVEDLLLKSNTHNLIVRTRAENALYVLNHKRAHLHELEERFGVTITISADQSLTGLMPFAIDKGDAVPNPIPLPRITEITAEVVDEPEDEAVEAEDDSEAEAVSEAKAEPEGSSPAARESREGGEESARGEGEGGRRRRRRRRRRRGGAGEAGQNGQNGQASGENGAFEESDEDTDSEEDGETGSRDSEAIDSEAIAAAPVTGEAAEAALDLAQDAAAEAASEAAEAPAGESPTETGTSDEGRRRRRRGGRRGRRDDDAAETASDEAVPAEASAPVEPAPADGAAEALPDAPVPDVTEPVAAEKPARKPRTRRAAKTQEAAPAETAPAVAEGAVEPAAPEEDAAVAEVKKAPRRRRSTVREPAPLAVTEETVSAPVVSPEPAAPDEGAEAASASSEDGSALPATPPQDEAPTLVEAAEASPDAPPATDEATASSDTSETPSSGPSDDENRPRRTGWWQRKIFGN
ncbi:ribonuclease E/G [Ancylobacter lacus]|uniref:ribonuclease E/G n=1 Tax=Ancylobacter lacus TaxID=2579970 RepID=UPI001BD100D6|nr:ribonuclease E/G [Ancylobacter lacus]MBS7540241.1 Rne/Rng family ribonuclease [Ancylobacter lacus]